MDASERVRGVGTAAAAARHPRHHLPHRDGLIGRTIGGGGLGPSLMASPIYSFVVPQVAEVNRGQQVV